MKAVVVPLFLAVLLAVPIVAFGDDPHTIVPAGEAGPGLYLDKVGPELVGSEKLPIVNRLPIVGRQPLWASYEIGEPITGGVRMYDAEGYTVYGSFIIVELYRLTFTNPTTLYKRLYREFERYDSASGIYRFSIPTDGLEAGFYQVRLGLPNDGELDPEFRVRIGDAVYTVVERPDDEAGCGCGG